MRRDVSRCRADVVGRRPDPRRARHSARHRLVCATRRALGGTRTERIRKDHAVPSRQPVRPPLARHHRGPRRAARPYRRSRAAPATGCHQRGAGRHAATGAPRRGHRRHRQACRPGAVVAQLLGDGPGSRARAAPPLRMPGVGRRRLRHAVIRRTPARPAGPHPDERSGAVAARRADGGARPGRSRAARGAVGCRRRRSRRARHRAGDPPRRGDSAGVHARAAAARRRRARRRADRGDADCRARLDLFRDADRAGTPRRSLAGVAAGPVPDPACSQTGVRPVQHEH